MKVRVVADLHLGASHTLFPDLTDYTFKALAEALSGDQALTVLAGDVFHSPYPTPRDAAHLMDLIAACSHHVIAIDGNHDRGRRGSALALLASSRIQNLDVYLEPGIYADDDWDVRVGLVPWPERFDAHGRADVTFTREVDCDGLIVHGAFDGHPLTPPGERTLRLYPSWRGAVVAGHLHQPMLHPLAHYPGSLMPINFGETHRAGWLDVNVDPVDPLDPVRVEAKKEAFPHFVTVRASELDDAAPSLDALSAVRVLLEQRYDRDEQQRAEDALDAAHVERYVFVDPAADTTRPESDAIARYTNHRDIYSAYLESLARPLEHVEVFDALHDDLDGRDT